MSSEPVPLPPDRVNDCAVFETVGIDLAGPLFLENIEKVWIALFTCGVYRAIHLELVRSLSYDSFNLAMRRVIARRGRPKTIYFDNGTNFKGSCNELSKLDWNQIQREDNLERMSWKFKPQLLFGGVAGGRGLFVLLRSYCDVHWEIRCCLLKNLKLLFVDVNLLLILDLCLIFQKSHGN
ncbi:hypothetical protein AVEN_65043-1 [Araneus ventricosus]|uniref:Integrase catalytic domain-containing protein n=1 Tax=Araneus ventricosus TaxID=182803 RepID=A0A4Y2X7H3_ARAVE|nr:hypothetical protein AVEN_65043-1 [Araneus ventricosus]